MIIRGALVALPGEQDGRVADVRVQGERIAEIGDNLTGDDEVVEAGGLVLLPGGIDPHVHFDDPGYTTREDFLCGSSAALAGGITTVVDMPCTSLPPVTNKLNLLQKRAVVEKKAVCDYGFYAGICEQTFDEAISYAMRDMASLVLGFKTYFISGMKTFERLNHFQFRRVLERARDLDLPVLLHAEDFDYVKHSTPSCVREGDSPRHFYKSRPEAAEVIAVSAAVELAREAEANLHIVHLGAARAAELVEAAASPTITGETAPHYLAFDLRDFERMGSPLKITPPVKGPGNRERLWELLSTGGISFVASDHAPCTEREKKTGSIWTDYSGIPGTGTLLPYLFSEGYLAGKLSLERLAEVTATAAAKRYGLAHRKGAIEPGLDADFALFDPEGSWTVDPKQFLTKGRVTPFDGMTFRGRLVKTFLRGREVYDSAEGLLALPGYGHFLTKDGQGE